MKIAVSTEGITLDANVDPRFGRAKGFIIFDLDSSEYKYIDNNQNMQAMQGAGIQSAKTIIDSGAQVLITGNVGPKAFSALDSAGIDIRIGSSGLIKNAIEDYKNGVLIKAEGANRDGHW